MEACNFGHRPIVDLLLSVPNIDLEAMNIRGQHAEDVAMSRGHDSLVQLIQSQRHSRGTFFTAPYLAQVICISHCSKVKMNGKKLRKFQFHFPEFLGTKFSHQIKMSAVDIVCVW